MTFNRVRDREATVNGIPSTRQLKDALKANGEFNEDETVYTIKSPFGRINAALDWGSTNVRILIKDKPLLVSYNEIWKRIREEVDRFS